MTPWEEFIWQINNDFWGPSPFGPQKSSNKKLASELRAAKFQDAIGTTDGFPNTVLDATIKARGYDSGYLDNHVKEEARLLTSEQTLQNQIALAALRRRLARESPAELEQLRTAHGVFAMPPSPPLDSSSSFMDLQMAGKAGEAAARKKADEYANFADLFTRFNDHDLEGLLIRHRLLNPDGSLQRPNEQFSAYQAALYAAFASRYLDGRFTAGGRVVQQQQQGPRYTLEIGPSITPTTVPAGPAQGSSEGPPNTSQSFVSPGSVSRPPGPLGSANPTVTVGPDGTVTPNKQGNLLPPDSGGTGQPQTPRPGPPGAFPDELFRRNPPDP